MIQVKPRYCPIHGEPIYNRPMFRGTRIIAWRLAALCSLALAVVGAMLPVLPTIPLLITAAWAGGKGWPSLEQRLLGHRTYGAPIRAWRERGAVPRRAKQVSILGMTGSSVALQFLPLPMAVRIGVPVAMLIVALWLWRRPEA